jgi:hypothetical protein
VKCSEASPRRPRRPPEPRGARPAPATTRYRTDVTARLTAATPAPWSIKSTPALSEQRNKNAETQCGRRASTVPFLPPSLLPTGERAKRHSTTAALHRPCLVGCTALPPKPAATTTACEPAACCIDLVPRAVPLSCRRVLQATLRTHPWGSWSSHRSCAAVCVALLRACCSLQRL